MTSLIRSHIQYLVQTYHILVLILKSKLMKNLTLMPVQYDLMMIRDGGYFFGPPCIFSWMPTTACCLVVGSGLELDLVSYWLVLCSSIYTTFRCHCHYPCYNPVGQQLLTTDSVTWHKMSVKFALTCKSGRASVVHFVVESLDQNMFARLSHHVALLVNSCTNVGFFPRYAYFSDRHLRSDVAM